ncbi:MAG: RNA methyltransferase [Rhodoferax sp.]
MSAPVVLRIQSRDNALYKRLRRLAHGSTDYRSLRQLWVEGDHLLRAALARGVGPVMAVFSEEFWSSAHTEYAQAATKIVVISTPLFAQLSALPSPVGMGFVFDLPTDATLDPWARSVVLDRLQDAGNVGAILRSASAFGWRQIIALRGTAALWSPKVLRAGMGAHWNLCLIEGASLADVQALRGPLGVTSSHQGDLLHERVRRQDLPANLNWAFGHEGQGVSAAVQALAQLQIRIAQPGGEESLNVAAAAAICLHASATVAHGLP